MNQSALVERIAQLEREKVEIAGALRYAVSIFRYYEMHYTVKNEMMKAKNNSEHAEYCENALVKVGVKP